MKRAGATVLVVVLLLGAVASVLVFATHFLWRNSSRTLFSVQEQRELVNLARSSVSEAYFELQRAMDSSTADWVDWCIARETPEARQFEPAMTRENAALMSPDQSFLSYTCQPIQIRRVQGMSPEEAEEGRLGLIDMEVEVAVRRESPRHEARLHLIARHSFRLAMSSGPYGSGGRHISITPTPVATWLEAL